MKTYYKFICGFDMGIGLVILIKNFFGMSGTSLAVGLALLLIGIGGFAAHKKEK